MPHELLAKALAGKLPTTAGGGTYDWTTLAKPLPDAKGNLLYRGAPSQKTQSGQLKLAGREFSLLASGLQTQVSRSDCLSVTGLLRDWT